MLTHDINNRATNNHVEQVKRQPRIQMNEIFKDLQIVQNNLMRYISGKRLSDKISIKQLLLDTNFLSINQINAQIKLAEIWKAINVEKYPLKVCKKVIQNNMATIRAISQSTLIESGKSDITQNACVNDATRLWNQAPKTVTEANSIFEAKKQIKLFVKTLPI